MTNKEIRFKRFWIHVGYNLKGFGLGFRIDKYNANIDFLWFWIGIEY